MPQQKTKPASPASVAIKAFGGVRALARALDYAPSTVSRWDQPKRKGGSNGMIPSSAVRAILKIAGERGISLSANDLVLGREE